MEKPGRRQKGWHQAVTTSSSTLIAAVASARMYLVSSVMRMGLHTPTERGGGEPMDASEGSQFDEIIWMRFPAM